ncbi:MAG: hypothetical protein ACRYG7_06285 [Janthinobacterium lividum]
MAKQTKPVWYGVAAVAAGTGIFFLATNKGRLFKKVTTGIQALVGSVPATAPARTTTTLARAPAPNSPGFQGRTPTADNGHVRDVIATNPPADDSGSNFTQHGDVHGPQ